MENLKKRIEEIRNVENYLAARFKAGEMSGTLHLSIGQEYIPLVISQYLMEGDVVTSNHRGHAHAIATGVKPEELIQEVCEGVGGTQHILRPEIQFYSNGITGGMVPVACGLAFTIRKTKNIVVAYFGDGAVNEGYVLESFNIAQLFKLPILLVCENNGYAMGTRTSLSHSSPIAQKMRGFGLKGIRIKKNDYLMLDAWAKKLIRIVRTLREPRFIEIETYRLCGHSINDDCKYRSREEEEEWAKLDVLERMIDVIKEERE